MDTPSGNAWWLPNDSAAPPAAAPPAAAPPAAAPPAAAPPATAPPAVAPPVAAAYQPLTAQPVPGAPIFPGGVAVANPWLRLGSWFIDGIIACVTFGVGWLIWAAIIAGNGQTPGKQLLNLRVIGADTLRPASFARMVFLRGIVAGLIAYFAVTFTLGILLFMPFWDRRHQNLWDKISNSYVVTDPHDAWVTKPQMR